MPSGLGVLGVLGNYLRNELTYSDYYLELSELFISQINKHFSPSLLYHIPLPSSLLMPGLR